MNESTYAKYNQWTIMQFLRAEKDTDEQSDKLVAKDVKNVGTKNEKNNFFMVGPTLHLVGGHHSRILIFEDLLGLTKGTHISILVTKQFNHPQFNKEIASDPSSAVITMPYPNKKKPVAYSVLSAMVTDNHYCEKNIVPTKIKRTTLEEDVWGNGNSGLGLELPRTWSNFWFPFKYVLLHPNDVKFFGQLKPNR